MKKFMFVMAIVAIGSFAACNNAGSEAAKDSTAVKADSSKMASDSSAMKTDSTKMAADTTAKKDTTTKK